MTQVSLNKIYFSTFLAGVSEPGLKSNIKYLFRICLLSSKLGQWELRRTCLAAFSAMLICIEENWHKREELRATFGSSIISMRVVQSWCRKTGYGEIHFVVFYKPHIELIMMTEQKFYYSIGFRNIGRKFRFNNVSNVINRRH